MASLICLRYAFGMPLVKLSLDAGCRPPRTREGGMSLREARAFPQEGGHPIPISQEGSGARSLTHVAYVIDSASCARISKAQCFRNPCHPGIEPPPPEEDFHTPHFFKSSSMNPDSGYRDDKKVDSRFPTNHCESDYQVIQNFNCVCRVTTVMFFPVFKLSVQFTFLSRLLFWKIGICGSSFLNPYPFFCFLVFFFGLECSSLFCAHFFPHVSCRVSS